jgi:transposase
MLRPVNIKKRLAFAKQYVFKDKTFWREVIFSDKSKFNVWRSDGVERVYRRPKTELQARNVTKTVKHGGGSVMVWGCIAANGVGGLEFIDKTMTAVSYTNILRKHLRSSAQKLGLLQNFRFYQDNDPKHCANSTREWLIWNCPHILAPPPQSPDCNPIEHVWDYLDRKLRETPISSTAELRKRLQDEWNQIPVQFLEDLVLSMPRRLEAVLNARGGHTKY